jgi:hypothetical protein
MSFSHNIAALRALVQEYKFPEDTADEKAEPHHSVKPSATRMLSLSPQKKSERLVNLFAEGKALAKIIPSTSGKRSELYEQLYAYRYHATWLDNNSVNENPLLNIINGYHGMEAIRISRNASTPLRSYADAAALPVALIFDADMCATKDLYTAIASNDSPHEAKDALRFALHHDKSGGAGDVVLANLYAIDSEHHSIALQGIVFGENTPAMRAFAREVHVDLILTFGEKFNSLPIAFYDAAKKHVELYTMEQRHQDVQDWRAAEKIAINKLKTDLEAQLHAYGCGLFLRSKIKLVHENETRILSRLAAHQVIKQLKDVIAEELSLPEVLRTVIKPLFENGQAPARRPKI